MLLPSAKDRVYGPAFEENLALIQTIFGENSRAISTLTRLLQTPYSSWLYGPTPVTPALLKARSDLGPFARRSRFPKTLRGKAAVKYWEIIIENLRNAGWNCGFMATTDGKGRPIWVVAAERSDAGRFMDSCLSWLPVAVSVIPLTTFPGNPADKNNINA